MTVYDKDTIIESIEENIKDKGGKYSDWYVGITNDPERRKVEHKNPSGWLPCDAESENTAREIEKYFLDKGCKGAKGGGEEDSRWVYVFREVGLR